jgi:hypothetical protein
MFPTHKHKVVPMYRFKNKKAFLRSLDDLPYSSNVFFINNPDPDPKLSLKPDPNPDPNREKQIRFHNTAGEHHKESAHICHSSDG